MQQLNQLALLSLLIEIFGELECGNMKQENLKFAL